MEVAPLPIDCALPMVNAAVTGTDHVLRYLTDGAEDPDRARGQGGAS